MKSNTIAIILGLALAAGMNARATENRPHIINNAPTQSTVKDPVILEFRAAELSRRTGDFLLAPVKSRFDLNQYVRAYPNSPINMLSPSAKQRFLGSLTFNETGLTGFDYSDLRAELTVSQVYQVLSLFGAQRVTSMVRGARVENATDKALQASLSPLNGGWIGIGDGFDDHEGYRCESSHTCSSRSSRICMSGC